VTDPGPCGFRIPGHERRSASKEDVGKVTSSKSGRIPAHIQALVERVDEATSDPVYAARKQMWTRHNRLEKVAKVPVNVHFHRGYRPIWRELIPPDTLISEDPLELAVELELRQKLFKHEQIPDDDLILPTVWIEPVRSGAPAGDGTYAALGYSSSGSSGSSRTHDTDEEAESRAAHLWGIPLRRRQTSVGGAYIVDPVVDSDEDLAGLHPPRYTVDEQATRDQRDRVVEMVGGRLPVKVTSDEVKASPSEWMVAFMGIEAILYGVVDRPDFIHRVMEFVTEGTIAYQRTREAAGAVDAEETWGFRTHYEDLPPGANPHALENNWAYVSAQSLCSISPAMFEEFLQPYHARLAEMHGQGRVYYHGCEDLTAKIPIIRQLPNLRRFHVSAWTNLEEAVKQLGRDYVLETCVHTPDTLAVHTPEQMRVALERIMSVAGDHIIDINITDPETQFGKPDTLATWARVAQEVTAKYA